MRWRISVAWAALVRGTARILALDELLFILRLTRAQRKR
jgi:hypothetical protein